MPTNIKKPGYTDLDFFEDFASLLDIFKNGGSVIGSGADSGEYRPNSTTGRIEYTWNQAYNVQPFTVVFKGTVFPKASFQTIVAKRTTSTPAELDFRCFVTNTNYPQLFWGTDAQAYAALLVPVPNSTEITLAWGIASGKVFYYVNGQYVETSVTIQNLQGKGSLILPYKDATYNGQPNYKGVNIYRRALSKAELDDIKNSTTYTEVDFKNASYFLPLRTYYVSEGIYVTDNLGTVGGTVTLNDGTTTTGHAFRTPRGDRLSTGGYFSNIANPTGSYTVVTYNGQKVTFDNTLATLTAIKTASGYNGLLAGLVIYPFVLTTAQQKYIRFKLENLLNN